MTPTRDAVTPMRADIALERNAVLASIALEARADLGSVGSIVELRCGDLLRRVGRNSEYVWLPLSGMVSLTVPLPDGTTVEVGLVGREGLVGLSSLVDGSNAADEALVQLPGQALRVESTTFRMLMARDHSMRFAILRYAQDLFAFVSQTAACNVRHALLQRLARWILLVHDRSDGGPMPLTQGLLANMLGVQRTSVCGGAQYLQQQGAIEYSRGRLTVTNRTLLEQLSCGCYEAAQLRIGNAARTFDHRKSRVPRIPKSPATV